MDNFAYSSAHRMFTGWFTSTWQWLKNYNGNNRNTGWSVGRNCCSSNNLQGAIPQKFSKNKLKRSRQLIYRCCNVANAWDTHWVWSHIFFHHEHNICSDLCRNKLSLLRRKLSDPLSLNSYTILYKPFVVIAPRWRFFKI